MVNQGALRQRFFLAALPLVLWPNTCRAAADEMKLPDACKEKTSCTQGTVAREFQKIKCIVIVLFLIIFFM